MPDEGGEGGLISDKLLLRVASLGGITYISELADRTKNVSFVEGDPQQPMWRLTAGLGREASSVESSGFKSKWMKIEEGLLIDWPDVSLGGGRCNVQVLLRNLGEHISLSLSASSKDPLPLSYVTFPIIGRIQSGTAFLSRGYGKAVPWERGRLSLPRIRATGVPCSSSPRTERERVSTLDFTTLRRRRRF